MSKDAINRVSTTIRQGASFFYNTNSFTLNKIKLIK